MTRTPSRSQTRSVLVPWCGAIVLALSGCGAATDVAVAGDGEASSASASPSSPSSSPSEATGEASPSAQAAAQGPTQTVPVYYVADVQSAPRLYREFHRVPDGQDRAMAAVTEMLGGTATDPDYGSAWPSDARLLSLTRSGSIATVDVSGFVSTGAEHESAAVQQLVFTVTAADPDITAVRLTVNGQTPPSGHTTWTDPVSRQTSWKIMSHAWVLAPLQGQAVSSPVTVRVYGTGFEGNHPIKVRDASDAVVAETFVTTAMGSYAQAETTVDLPAGEYTVEVYTDGGEDSSLDLWDTKTFTVK